MQLVGMLVSITYIGTIKLSRKIGREIKTKYQEMYFKNTCTVCQEKLTGATFQTHCHHQFHHSCLLQWFVANMQNLPVEFVREQVIKSPDEEVIYTCPLCRRSLRSDYYNNMICTPHGYQYSEKFKGDPLRDSFPVFTPQSCAQACDTESLCHAYTIGYDYGEIDRSIRETVCRLFQSSITRNDKATKKKNKEKKTTVKHAIHNVCRKQTADQEPRLSQHLPTLDISTQSRLYKIITLTKAYLELLKVFSLFFISVLNNLWTYIKIYTSKSPAYFMKLLFQPILPKHVRWIIIPWSLIFLFGHEWDVLSAIHLKTAYFHPSAGEKSLSFIRSKPSLSLKFFSLVHAVVVASIINKNFRTYTYRYYLSLQKILAMYFTYLVVQLILYGELFSSNSGLFLVLLYLGHLYDVVI